MGSGYPDNRQWYHTQWLHHHQVCPPPNDTLSRQSVGVLLQWLNYQPPSSHRRDQRPELEESESNGEWRPLWDHGMPPFSPRPCQTSDATPPSSGYFSERSSRPEAKINSLGGWKKVSAVQGHLFLQETWDLSPANIHFGAHTVYNSSSREPNASF